LLVKKASAESVAWGASISDIDYPFSLSGRTDEYGNLFRYKGARE
jgi:hypothetical protein